MGIKQSAPSSKTELNMLFRKPRRPDTDSATSRKRGARIKTIHASGVKSLPFSHAREWNSYIRPLPYSATLVAFYLLTTTSKKLEGTADNELSRLSSHCCCGNNGVQESWQRYSWLHKQQQKNKKKKMFEKLIHKKAPDVSEKQTC